MGFASLNPSYRLPDRAAADKFWNEEPFAKNGGYQRDARITRWVFGD